MIGQLIGTVAFEEADGTFVLEVGGWATSSWPLSERWGGRRRGWLLASG